MQLTEGVGLAQLLLNTVQDVLDVHTYTVRDGGETIVFTGRLREASGDAYARLERRLYPLGYRVLLRRDRGQDVVITTPATQTPSRSRLWLNLLLLIATAFTTLVSGAFLEGRVPWSGWDALLAGAPFTAAMLGILGVHELGHYVAARYYRMDVSLPYFIPFLPFPFGIGTMGAVIRLRSPMTNRKALFDVGLAGPIAGLLVAIPVLVIGLQRSQLMPAHALAGGVLFKLGEPLLFKAIARLVLGPIPPGAEIALSSIAFAGWVGLFVTAMNLLPIGQLDGGHVAYAVWGRGHNLLARTTFVGLILLGAGPWLLNLIPGIGPVSGWSGWLVWALLLSAFGLRHPPALDDVTPLGWPRKLLGVLTLLLMLSLITPVPFSVQ